MKFTKIIGKLKYKASYDSEFGSTYVYIKDGKVVKTMPFPHAEVLVDVDSDNNILGIEVLNVKVGNKT